MASSEYIDNFFMGVNEYNMNIAATSHIANSVTNRYIFVNKTPSVSSALPPFKSTVLVNPHFKENVITKVFINPNFKPVPINKPKIHVNPNFKAKTLPAKPASDKQLGESNLTKEFEQDKRTLVSTRTKIIRLPQTSEKSKSVISPQRNVTQYSTNKRRNSIHSKYKIIRNIRISLDGNQLNNKYKLNRLINAKEPEPSYCNMSNRKKYVYINRFPSLTFIANNVILKHNVPTKTGFVNIKGILYRKSPNSLKRSIDSLHKSSKTIRKSKYKFEQKPLKLQEHKTILRMNKITKHKLIRTMKISPLKLKKSNVACQIFRKYGKCRGKENGSCIKIHNPNQIILCTRFLQGACIKTNCLLSHKVLQEKMPTCKYYLEGLCSRDDCPYLHVKISPKADICRDFLEGYCKEADKCTKRHQWLCPDYEKNGQCPKPRCPYLHKDMVRKSTLSKVAKKSSAKKDVKIRQPIKSILNKNHTEKSTNTRYYNDKKVSATDENCKDVNEVPSRPKLGSLPSFIPLLEDR